MAGEPSTLVGQHPNIIDDSDLDAEYEEEDIATYHTASVSGKGAHNTGSEDEDLDAEGEDDDIDAEGEDDDDELVGPVKMPRTALDEEDGDEDAAGESASDVKSDNESDADAESDAVTESDPENAWEAESDTAEEVEAEIVDPNQCM
jgi:histone acetyltransferase SAS3